MNVKINTVHFKADKKLETFIKEKLQKMPTLFDGVISTEVILKLEHNESKNNKIAEVRLVIPGNDLYAEKRAKSFEEAADSAVEAVKKQLVRYKEKIRGM
jgi:putative sigma-54 modulation protein